MTDLTQEMLTRFDAIAAKLNEAAPVAYQKLVDLMFIKSLVDMIQIIFAFIALFFLYHATKVCWAKALAQEEAGDDGVAIAMLGFCLFGIGIILALLVGGALIFNGEMYIGLISPESRLILEFMETVKK